MFELNVIWLNISDRAEEELKLDSLMGEDQLLIKNYTYGGHPSVLKCLLTT